MNCSHLICLEVWKDNNTLADYGIRDQSRIYVIVVQDATVELPSKPIKMSADSVPTNSERAGKKKEGNTDSQTYPSAPSDFGTTVFGGRA